MVRHLTSCGFLSNREQQHTPLGFLLFTKQANKQTPPSRVGVEPRATNTHVVSLLWAETKTKPTPSWGRLLATEHQTKHKMNKTNSTLPSIISRSPSLFAFVSISSASRSPSFTYKMNVCLNIIIYRKV